MGSPPGQIPADRFADPVEAKLFGKPAALPVKLRKAKDDLTLEREEHKRFLSHLERGEYAYDHSRTDRRTTNKVGVPDFLIPCYRLAIEFKRPGQYLTDEQVKWRERHEARGGIYHIVYQYEEAFVLLESL